MKRKRTLEKKMKDEKDGNELVKVKDDPECMIDKNCERKSEDVKDEPVQRKEGILKYFNIKMEK